MARARFYLPGMLYTRLLEVLLRGMRRAVCDIVLRNDLYPLLDLCCGPGTQAGLLRRQGQPVPRGGGASSRLAGELSSSTSKSRGIRLPGSPISLFRSSSVWRVAAISGTAATFSGGEACVRFSEKTA